jgi:D-glycero-alpha-D-manno-heptose-7-phosphate kinase
MTKTPIRVTFTGGSSDFPQFYRNYGPGAVVSATINRYIYVTVARNFYSDEYRISYSKTENAIKRLEDIEHPTVREALRHLDIKGGIQIISITEIPSRGTGLGSSSSFLVGLLLALHTWSGETVTSETLASEAYKIEREILNEPGGKQDQYMAAYGGINLLQFNADESIIVKPIVLKKEDRNNLERSLIMFYSGIERPSATIHTDQIKKIDERVEYYKKMRDIAFETYNAISKMDLDRLGKLLEENWLLKKQLSNEISNTFIDDLYKHAKNAGALGGKLMGAGGGGFLLFLAPPERHQAICKVLKDYRKETFKIDPFGARIAYVEDNQ